MSTQHAKGWTRRRFLGGLTLAGTAGVLGLAPRSVAAEPPPETTTLRIHENPIQCIAPQIVAQEMLYGEGFTEVKYVKFLKDTQHFPPEDLLAGEVDIAFSFSPTTLQFIDAGSPLVILAAAHTGCVELFANDRIGSTRDLKGKTVGFFNDTKVFISMFVAYVGLDPRQDIHWVPASWDDQVALFTQGKIDAFLGGPPTALELRHKKIGHTLVNTTLDKPWSQYSCCLIASTKAFVHKHPVATKRALRAILKAVDLCALEPNHVARFMADHVDWDYDSTLQWLRELPFGKWREIDVTDSLTFWALRLHDVGAIKGSPPHIIARGADWRFLNELKKELKG
jgi:NitT/TauT family transport system substrate-binding protein